MGTADYLDLGQWNTICDRCGKKYKANELRKEWDGLMVCWRCYEIRQPQDYVRSVPDKQAPPWTRPDSDQFESPFCDLQGISSVADFATADCWVADLVPSGLYYTP